MAGYSGTPLPQKLGIKPGHVVLFVDAPDDFAKTLGALPEGVSAARASARSSADVDVMVAFVTSRAVLAKRFDGWKKRLRPSGGLWIGWPKKASGMKTDLTEDVVRELALAKGLVDNKVCAIDETWSGLRLVYRLSDRPATKARTAH
ncbi:MAG: DUF3052 family protein [Myxococcaceae bacterium]|nr:DUF3052 family protein [Myxococcaceae bacterium]